MKIVAISGSPKTRSTTEGFLNLFLQGMGNAVTHIDRFYPAQMQINYCRACYRCWFHTPGQCQHQDDFQRIGKVLTDMDLFLLATPLHLDGMPASVKNVLDRMLATLPPFMYVDNEGRTRHHKNVTNKPKALLISGCGFPEASNFAPLITHFKAICKNMAWDYAGHITIAAAPASNFMPNFTERAQLIEDAGRVFAQQGYISESIMSQMNTSWIDAEAYRDYCNTHFANILNRTRA